MRFHRPSHGTIVAYTALAVALGGTSYAAVNVTGQQVKDSSLTGRDVKNGSLTGNDIKKRSVPIDRLSGALPTGPMGPAGPAGPAGAKGEPDTSKFYDKPAADGRFLAKTAKATDADTLDGLDSTAFARGGAAFDSASLDVPAGSSQTLLALPGWGSVAVLNCNSTTANVGLTRDPTGITSLWTSTSTTPAGGSAGTNWASAGSYSGPSGWNHYRMARADAVADIEVFGRWNGVGCTFAITSAIYGT